MATVYNLLYESPIANLGYAQGPFRAWAPPQYFLSTPITLPWTDENPERVSVLQRLTAAYLRTQLYPGDSAWQLALDALAADPDPLGRVESKER